MITQPSLHISQEEEEDDPDIVLYLVSAVAGLLLILDLLLLVLLCRGSLWHWKKTDRVDVSYYQGRSQDFRDGWAKIT